MTEKGLRQSDVAYMSNIAQGTISEYLNIEIGRTPGAAELGRLANTLGVTMGWLWGMEDENSARYTVPPSTQKVMKLEGKLEFARKTLRGALAYLDDNDNDHTSNLRVADSEEPYIGK